MPHKLTTSKGRPGPLPTPAKGHVCCGVGSPPRQTDQTLKHEQLPPEATFQPCNSPEGRRLVLEQTGAPRAGTSSSYGRQEPRPEARGSPHRPLGSCPPVRASGACRTRKKGENRPLVVTVRLAQAGAQPERSGARPGRGSRNPAPLTLKAGVGGPWPAVLVQVLHLQTAEQTKRK